MKKKISYVAPILLLISGIGIYLFSSFSAAQALNIPSGAPFQTMATSGVITINGTGSGAAGGAAELLLATTSRRAYVGITNDCPQVVYLAFNPGSRGTGSTTLHMRLNANGGAFEIDQNNLYTGAIYATTTAVAFCNVSVTQAVY